MVTGPMPRNPNATKPKANTGGGFHHLRGCNRKIFAQHRQPDGASGGFEIRQAPLKKALVRKYGQRRRAPLLVLAGDARRIEIRAHQPPAGRRLLHLGDNRWCARRERGAEIAARREAQISLALPAVETLSA